MINTSLYNKHWWSQVVFIPKCLSVVLNINTENVGTSKMLVFLG